MSTFFIRRLALNVRSTFKSRPLSTKASSGSSTIFRTLRTGAVISSLAISAYTAGSLYPPTLLTYISPRQAPPPPDPDHPDSVTYLISLEEQLHTLPLLAELRSRPDAHDWYETRPYAKIPEEKRVNNLTAGALRGPGRLALPPLVRAKKDETESVIFVHVGRGLCGHDGIVHGGMLATLLDESLARTAILNLPDKVGVTANLNISYRAPTKADQFVVIKVRLNEAKGRKSFVSGCIEDLSGNLLVEAKAMFVQPRYAKLLSSSGVREALGAPPAAEQPKRPVEDLLPPPIPAPGAAKVTTGS